MTTKPQSETASHTPGPWQITRIKGTSDRLYVEALNDDAEQSVCVEVMPYEENEIRPTDEANARLIAASPELLAALQEILRIPERYDVCPAIAMEMYEIARAAIAKATHP